MAAVDISPRVTMAILVTLTGGIPTITAPGIGRIPMDIMDTMDIPIVIRI